MTALVMGSFISIYQTVSLNVTLPGFMHIFDAELSTVQWLMTGFTLATGIIAPISGYLGNRFGTRELFLFSIGGLIITSLLCAFAWSIGSLIVFRITQGIFCGIIQPVTLTIIFQMLPNSKHSTALGLWSASSVLGPALAPTISGWLQTWNWPMIFLTMLPIGGAAWIIGWMSLDKKAEVKKVSAFNGIGMIGVVCGSLSLLILFSNLHQWGVSSSKSLFFLLIGAAFLIHFSWRELRIKDPLLELRLFKNKDFTLSLVVSAVLTCTLYTGIYFIPLYLVEVHRMSAIEVGLLLFLPALSMTVATIICSKYYNRFGAKPFILIGILFIILATWMFSYLTVHSTKGFVMLWMTCRYIGLGLATTPIMNVGMSAVTSKLTGDASAMINWGRQVGGAMSIGLFTSFFYTRIDFYEKTEVYSNEVYVKGLDDVFIVATMMTCICIPLSLLLGRKKVKQKDSRIGEEVSKGI